MNPLLILKILSIVEKGIALGRDVRNDLKPIKDKLEAVHAQGRQLTPAEFEEIEAQVAVKMEQLLDK